MKPDDFPTPFEQLERRELCQEALAAIGRLTKSLRETTTLFYIDGYSVGEVATIQEVPAGTVKRRLHDARKELKKELMTMVEDTLKSESTREKLAQKVFDMLRLYDRPAIPSEKWDEVKTRLREIGADGIEGFIRALESPHSPTRRFALRMLQDAGQNEDMVERLLIEATGDSNKEVRKVAFSALFDIAWHSEEKRQGLIPHILPALRDRSKKARQLAWRLAPKHVPLEEAARAVIEKGQTEPFLLQGQHDLIEAALCVREGKENPHEKSY